MKNAPKKIIIEAISVIFRFALAITFIWACIHKIGHPFDFALQVATYQILPLSLVNLQALLLPWIELGAGIALIAGFWTRPAALVTIGMNIMFIVAIAMALSAELQLQCGCFSSDEAGGQMTQSLIVRDAAFMLVGAVLLIIPLDRFTLDKVLEKKRKNNDE